MTPKRIAVVVGMGFVLATAVVVWSAHVRSEMARRELAAQAERDRLALERVRARTAEVDRQAEAARKKLAEEERLRAEQIEREGSLLSEMDRATVAARRRGEAMAAARVREDEERHRAHLRALDELTDRRIRYHEVAERERREREAEAKRAAAEEERRRRAIMEERAVRAQERAAEAAERTAGRTCHSRVDDFGNVTTTCY